MNLHETHLGQTVVYRAQGGTGGPVEAKVRRRHREGSVTVEATFNLTEQGETVPGYLGYRFRMSPEMLTPKAEWVLARRAA
jgi:hypothetical protein